jgi:hypothetical protein
MRGSRGAKIKLCPRINNWVACEAEGPFKSASPECTAPAVNQDLQLHFAKTSNVLGMHRLNSQDRPLGFITRNLEQIFNGWSLRLGKRTDWQGKLGLVRVA